MSDRPLRWLTAALALAGLGVSAYLTYTKYAEARIFCSTGGCETVQTSKYATLGGFLPVPVLGLIGYVGILVVALVPGRLGLRASVLLATVAAAFSIYLLALQLWVIDAICVWCLASEAISWAIFVVALGRLALARRRGRPEAARA
ncbi:MAG: vitamin K epoxide reductase family protein [Thermoleophilia bacterium]